MRTQETANESGDEEVPSHAEAFVAFKKELRWFEVQSECNSTQFTYVKRIM